jgi:hypothetical protein
LEGDGDDADGCFFVDALRGVERVRRGDTAIAAAKMIDRCAE